MTESCCMPFRSPFFSPSPCLFLHSFAPKHATNFQQWIHRTWTQNKFHFTLDKENLLKNRQRTLSEVFFVYFLSIVGEGKQIWGGQTFFLLEVVMNGHFAFNVFIAAVKIACADHKKVVLSSEGDHKSCSCGKSQ